MCNSVITGDGKCFKQILKLLNSSMCDTPGVIVLKPCVSVCRSVSTPAAQWTGVRNENQILEGYLGQDGRSKS